MRRRAFLALAGLALPSWAAPGRFDRGLLWRISRKGAAPSHVYGTIHVADARLGALPQPVRAAFERARSLMVEFLPDSDAAVRFTEAALLPEGSTLEQLIGREDFERAVERLKPAGLDRGFVSRLKPWAVLLNLRGEGAGQGVPVDAQLMDLARARRLPLSQIEGVEEQIFTFDEFPLASQVVLLRHSLGHRVELEALAERTLEAYLARDLAAIWRLREAYVGRHPEVAPHQAAMTKRIVFDRSVVMAYRMQRELRRGGAFVAFGALHLYGPKGVLALLEGDGFYATRVY